MVDLFQSARFKIFQILEGTVFFFSNEIGVASTYGTSTSASGEASAAYGDTESKKEKKIA